MKILTTCLYHYYGDPRGVEPQFYYLYRVPRTLGHEVDFFDWQIPYAIGPDQLRSQFLTLLRGKKYDAVFLATYRDEFDEATLAEARKLSTIIAFNSDDEDRWETYSRQRIRWFDFMVTNSPDVHGKFRGEYPNLLHAQWACCGFWDGRTHAKDIDISFVGQIYGSRATQVDRLANDVGLRAFGKGLRPNVRDLAPTAGALKAGVAQFLVNALYRRIPNLFPSTTIDFDAVNALWNRSRVSFTPLESSRGSVLQIKSRVFDMGLSGTLMIAPAGAGVERYYEPGKEFIEYHNLDDFAEKARYYCSHEAERAAIAAAYARRTEAEHMWRHRIETVLRDAGLSR